MKNKIARVCWNDVNWQYPSGSTGKVTSKDSYENLSGFGHEEWLFDRNRIVDGYHYAFLQPLNKGKHHIGQTYNISLYTICGSKKSYYVGKINNVERITIDESIKIYDIYRNNGWLKTMELEVKKAGGNIQTFVNTAPTIFFNIKFRFSECDLVEDMVQINDNDINLSNKRYLLLDQKAEFSFEEIKRETRRINRKGSTTAQNTSTVQIPYRAETEYNPRHKILQDQIFELLKNSDEYISDTIIKEEGYIDIKAKTPDGKTHYYEIKTYSALKSIRTAIGQIMEYAYFPNNINADKLIILSDSKPSKDITTYLSYLREKFNLPIYYKYYDPTKKLLSIDY